MDVGDFLRELGLQQYEAAFRDNRIDIRVLPKLTAEDLKDLGVTLVGDRRVLLGLLATFDDQAASRNLRPSRSRLARPYIWRLMVFSRLICPSTCPLLQANSTAARTAS